MKKMSVYLAAAACGMAASIVSADSLTINFESYNLGELTSANGGYAAADGRLPGQADGANKWWNPGNTATLATVATRAARTGSNGLVLTRRDTSGALDGVINGVQTPRLAQMAGETSAPVNATNSRFRFSYWFKTGTSTPVPHLRCGAEAWGVADRNTWHRFYADGAGNLNFYSVGTINNAALDYFPVEDTLIASNLTWGAWYRVEVTVSFVNGGDDNDQVITRLFNASNVLVGTGIDTTWESGQRHAGFSGGQPFGVDSFAFQARAADPDFTAYAGDVAYIDDISFESLAPVDTKLNVAQSCTNASQIDVTIDLTNTNQSVAGGQFFLQYDNTKLTYVGGTPSATFSQEILDQQPAANQIDYACGIPFGGSAVNTPSRFATLRFNKLADVCAADNQTLVYFRPSNPPTRLSDQFGAQVGTVTADLAPFTMDSTAPVVASPAPAITLGSTPGGCTGVLSSVFNNTFDTAPALSNTAGPGLFYTDRYNPAGFTSASFLGQNRLKVSIDAADASSGRPPQFVSNFYNTQGRGYDVNLAPGSSLAADLYIPADWQTNIRSASLWGVAYESSNQINGYPILSFSSFNAADPNPNAPALTAQPRFRAWDPNNGGFVDIAMAVPYGSWVRMEIVLSNTSYVYKINNATVATFPLEGSVRIGSSIIQAYNFGQSYDVYWDNFNFGPPSPVFTDNCGTLTVNPVRSDNAPLTAPFPQGNTTITWTATDCAGNSTTSTQLVTVSGSSNFTAQIQLAGVTSGTFTRCIRFDFFEVGGCPNISATYDVLVTFVNGLGTASLPIDCGNYSCVTARDRLHTLRRTGTLVLGSGYTANFTGLNALLGGNLNDDSYVDILDFGGFAGQFNVNYGSASTTCSSTYPHADISGNGIVGIEDFSFIQANFLTFAALNCCNNQRPSGPITDISVRDLVAMGEWDAARGDFNRDGRLNTDDVQVLLSSGLPTCTADFNLDRQISVQDIFSFLSAWFSQQPAADINRDQTLGVQDIFDFLGHWFQGC